MSKTAAKEEENVVPMAETRKATELPEPQGWRILLAIPEVQEKTEGGIIKADITKDQETTGTVLGVVLKMGPLCYTDDRYRPSPDEDPIPWCRNGDIVLLGAYKGVRFKIHGKEFRIINEDTVQAVVEDPRGYTRA